MKKVALSILVLSSIYSCQNSSTDDHGHDHKADGSHIDESHDHEHDESHEQETFTYEEEASDSHDEETHEHADDHDGHAH